MPLLSFKGCFVDQEVHPHNSGIGYTKTSKSSRDTVTSF